MRRPRPGGHTARCWFSATSEVISPNITPCNRTARSRRKLRWKKFPRGSLPAEPRRLASRERPAQRPTPVTPAEKQQQLRDDLTLIDDPQERLGVVVDRARQRPPLTAAERTEENRIKGCISQAWIVGELRDGTCHFRSDADSPLVRGLLALLGDCYDGSAPADVAATDCTIFEQTGLAKNLSPTRLNGLRSATAHVRAWAQSRS